MLDFFLSLFGGAYLTGKYVHNRAVNDRIDREIQSTLLSYGVWTDKHTDMVMENNLTLLFYDPAYTEELKKEVCSALSTLPSWRKYPELYGGPFYIDRDLHPYQIPNHVAMTILLANRGKIFSNAVQLYLTRDLYNATFTQMFEFANWLQSRLRDRGSDAKLYRATRGLSEMYAWEGSMKYDIMKRGDFV